MAALYFFTLVLCVGAIMTMPSFFLEDFEEDLRDSTDDNSAQLDQDGDLALTFPSYSVIGRLVRQIGCKSGFCKVRRDCAAGFNCLNINETHSRCCVNFSR